MIFYFSGTGNSKHVAERIAKDINDNIIDIEKCIDNEEYFFNLKLNENIGIITPVYNGGLPSIVREYLNRLTFKNSNYIFCVATYGTITGQSGYMANKILNKNGYSINAYYSVKMPDTWTPIFDLSDKNKNANKLEKAEAEIDSVIKHIKNKNIGNFMNNKVPKLFVKCYYPVYEMTRKTKHFTVQDTCIGCGLCAKRCPVNAIEIKNKKPVWVKEKCVMCLRCLHYCPKFSIQYGNNTKKHGQYYYEKYKK